MPVCENCKVNSPDVRERHYKGPLVADPAAASPHAFPGGGKFAKLWMCAHILVLKRMGSDL